MARHRPTGIDSGRMIREIQADALVFVAEGRGVDVAVAWPIGLHVLVRSRD
jgi:hypothetical protein